MTEQGKSQQLQPEESAEVGTGSGIDAGLEIRKEELVAATGVSGPLTDEKNPTSSEKKSPPPSDSSPVPLPSDADPTPPVPAQSASLPLSAPPSQTLSAIDPKADTIPAPDEISEQPAEAIAPTIVSKGLDSAVASQAEPKKVPQSESRSEEAKSDGKLTDAREPQLPDIEKGTKPGETKTGKQQGKKESKAGKKGGKRAELPSSAEQKQPHDAQLKLADTLEEGKIEAPSDRQLEPTPPTPPSKPVEISTAAPQATLPPPSTDEKPLEPQSTPTLSAQIEAKPPKTDSEVRKEEKKTKKTGKQAAKPSAEELKKPTETEESPPIKAETVPEPPAIATKADTPVLPSLEEKPIKSEGKSDKEVERKEESKEGLAEGGQKPLTEAAVKASPLPQRPATPPAQATPPLATVSPPSQSPASEDNKPSGEGTTTMVVPGTTELHSTVEEAKSAPPAQLQPTPVVPVTTSPSVVPVATPSPAVLPTPSPAVLPTPSPAVLPTPSPAVLPTPSPAVLPTPPTVVQTTTPAPVVETTTPPAIPSDSQPSQPLQSHPLLASSPNGETTVEEVKNPLAPTPPTSTPQFGPCEINEPGSGMEIVIEEHPNATTAAPPADTPASTMPVANSQPEETTAPAESNPLQAKDALGEERKAEEMQEKSDKPLVETSITGDRKQKNPQSSKIGKGSQSERQIISARSDEKPDSANKKHLPEHHGNKSCAQCVLQ